LEEAEMADDPTTPNPDDDKPADDPKPDSSELDKMKAALRKANKEAEENRRKLKELEDRDKSDSEKLSERVAAAERRAEEAEAKALRFEIAIEKGVKARWLSGSTREELEAAAEEYLADHPPANGTGPAPAKPVEDLRGGGEPAEGPEPDIRKIVESIPRGI
jgi:chromosome segregation ATPase